LEVYNWLFVLLVCINHCQERSMASDVESQASVSEPSQPFQPREDDDLNLFEVIEITAEKGGRYKVRWKGKDPVTKKPWAQSWVPKTDCTDDLVVEWKRKMKDKARAKGVISNIFFFLVFSHTNTFLIYSKEKGSRRNSAEANGIPGV